jgi:hypothetical protein
LVDSIQVNATDELCLDVGTFEIDDRCIVVNVLLEDNAKFNNSEVFDNDALEIVGPNFDFIYCCC